MTHYDDKWSIQESNPLQKLMCDTATTRYLLYMMTTTGWRSNAKQIKLLQAQKQITLCQDLTILIGEHTDFIRKNQQKSRPNSRKCNSQFRSL